MLAVVRTGDPERARRAAVGDEATLRALVDALAPRFMGIARGLARDHHEAEDLCQEALMKVTAPAVLRSYRGEGPLEGYLVNVGVRAMISRRRVRRGWRERVQLTGEPPDPPAAESAGGVAARGLSPPLREALEALPERARLVVLLIVLGDLSYAETAATLGLEVGTVKSAYSRARAQLRAVLSS
jgi:RNA polymerase sigma factor (sigma-70 family)